jgi:hypothetical protein
LGEPFEVVVPGFDHDLFFEIRRWSARGSTLPAIDDRVLVLVDDRNEPWVAAWWPAAGDEPITGERGADGDDGADGATWHVGTGAPDRSLGVDGDFYLDEATGDVYQKAAGEWALRANIEGPRGADGAPGRDGANGADGADGDDGKDGNTVLTTSGRPSNGTGVDGDFAYDPAASTMYGPKAAGAWPAGVSLRGADGRDGATGAAGRDGVDGDDGADGAAGEGIYRVRAATTANVTISSALNNGDSLDGVTLATGDRVLVKNQSTASQNGIYVVGVTPARATDADGVGEFQSGSVVSVSEGTANKDTLWMLTTNGTITHGSTGIAFAPAGAEHFPELAAGGPAKLAFGTGTVTFPGGSVASSTVNVTHGLGATPTSVVLTVLPTRYDFCIVDVTATSSTTFTVQMRSVGLTPPNGTRMNFSWLAMV